MLSKYALGAVALASLMLLPNLLWQAMHGWPFIEVIRGDAAHRPAFANGFALEYHDLASNAKAFALEQILYTNPLATPVWLAGAIAPFRIRSLRDMRFAGVAYAVAFIVAVALAAKGYYIVGIYAALLAAGAVAIERAATWLRVTLSVALCAVALISLPLSLPVLPVQTLVSYTQALGLTGRAGAPAHLIQPVFAEEFGWDRLASDVAAVYAALPPNVRARTAIYADTYADAGAIDFFGPALRIAGGNLEPEQLLSLGNARLRRPRTDRDRSDAYRSPAPVLPQRQARPDVDRTAQMDRRGSVADLSLPRSGRAAGRDLAQPALVRRVKIGNLRLRRDPGSSARRRCANRRRYRRPPARPLLPSRSVLADCF